MSKGNVRRKDEHLCTTLSCTASSAIVVVVIAAAAAVGSWSECDREKE